MCLCCALVRSDEGLELSQFSNLVPSVSAHLGRGIAACQYLFFPTYITVAAAAAHIRLPQLEVDLVKGLRKSVTKLAETAWKDKIEPPQVRSQDLCL